MQKIHVSNFKEQPTYEAPKAETSWEMNIKILQPWSVPVLGTSLPPEVLQTMTRISNKLIEDKNVVNFGKNLAGQVENELDLLPELLKEEEIRPGAMNFFERMIREFVVISKCQQFPQRMNEFIKRDNWLVQMTSAWITSQHPGEYNPLHIHTQCHISAVMYIKIPKMLPTRKEHRLEEDGSIIFVSNCSTDVNFCAPSITISPQVGDFFIFGSNQQHSVYPYRCEEGDPERRSISFNAVFQSQEDYDAGKNTI